MRRATLPLSGISVLDVSTYVAGPFAAMMLADLGADVVKVEPPGGDPNRRFGHQVQGEGMLFANTNRSKRSIVLDLKTDLDRARFESLVAAADVLLENWRPGVADRLGLADERLHALNPRLIRAAITGYGRTGPLAQRGAFDSAVQGLSGLAWHNRHAGKPELARTYFIDKATSAFAVQGVLAALLRRSQTGEAHRVEINMLDAAAYFNFPDVFEARTVVSDGSPVDPESNPGLKTLVPTADGHIIVAPTLGAHIRRACEAVGHPEWLAELKALRGFRELAPELMRRIATVTIEAPTAHWLEVFDRHDVPVAAVLDLDEHLAHPQVAENETYRRLSHRRLGPMRAPRYPASVRPRGSEPPEQSPIPFPDLDEHGDELRRVADAGRKPT